MVIIKCNIRYSMKFFVKGKVVFGGYKQTPKTYHYSCAYFEHTEAPDTLPLEQNMFTVEITSGKMLG